MTSTFNRALDLLLTYRPNKEQFPIIVTQVKTFSRCHHKQCVIYMVITNVCMI